ncbi:MAG TPA: amidohydrolase family protein [Patescibacteria group bacterium]|jgi:N-acyl-D-amino-acid deacylase|nr:amidohydrolase family protein [Patescibacteria group bacterium]
MYSLLIKKATLIDGTGAAAITADVAINGDRIVNIATEINSPAQEVVHADGKILTPGFIDIQNHSDSHWRLFDGPLLESILTQGYTTIMTGNSGASLAPLISEQALMSLQKWHTLEGANINWRSFAEFAESMSTQTFGVNVASLVGYSTLRRGLIADRQSAVSVEELQTLKRMADDALNEGAFGISTGFAYAHEANISDVELYELAKIVADHNAYIAIHLRDESGSVIESVREVIAAAEQAQASVKISHLKIRHKENWALSTDVLAELEAAWHRGVNVHFDVYPYTSTWQPIYTYLPSWATMGGRLQLLELLKDPTQRAKVLSALNTSETNIPELIIASTSAKLMVTGKRVSTIAAGFGTTSEEALLHLIENGGSEILVFDTSLSEQVVNDFCNHSLSFIGTNGSGYSITDTNKLVHPRCFGTAPKFLHNVIANKAISLPEAIRKLTSGPAKKIGLTDRGIIEVNAKADLVLFDKEKINSLASMANPYQYADGIEQVWVNGQKAITAGSLTGVKGGVFLKK